LTCVCVSELTGPDRTARIQNVGFKIQGGPPIKAKTPIRIPRQTPRRPQLEDIPHSSIYQRMNNCSHTQHLQEECRLRLRLWPRHQYHLLEPVQRFILTYCLLILQRRSSRIGELGFSIQLTKGPASTKTKSTAQFPAGPPSDEVTTPAIVNRRGRRPARVRQQHLHS